MTRPLARQGGTWLKPTCVSVGRKGEEARVASRLGAGCVRPVLEARRIGLEFTVLVKRPA